MMDGSSWQTLENGKPYPEPQTNFDPHRLSNTTPLPPKEDKIKEVLATYYDSVNRMDQIIGEVLKVLEKSGSKKNTLVIFLSDHGLAWDLSKWVTLSIRRSDSSYYPVAFCDQTPNKQTLNRLSQLSILHQLLLKFADSMNWLERTGNPSSVY
jgi:arylsulfatase A-like enzyme